MSLAAPQTVRLLVNAFKILSVLLLLSACSSNKAPVQDRMSPGSNKLQHHIVSRGETLYSIAWRYGIDYKELARRNSINRSYTIYPGQKILLSGKVVSRQASARKAKPAVKTVSSTRSKTTTTTKKPVKTPSVKDGRPTWIWPAQGRVLAGFSSSKSLNKGVDIEGRLGESVVAAASGMVVYAGSGIRGYGNLVIVKHNEAYLSAYAHNSKLLVKEQGFVKAGQKIAEIGNSGTDRSKLHFEIRHQGKPVDPLRYLPSR
ncbi:peptidoglycan DD-metalloendopeptidase family protein [Aestuariicella hydrocarbonica]|uniref:Peptidoglycan DD-metalloendopeptidase family protein n=1 Tax=Pseudomaricurvus hydrocarbonicus TaxID=1470433 RepID=A0A9E5T4V2_9GAMM|nr:peptidoglycan DD-metalloendopeptidase family protein [Aestuariicella hydrocarbonica]NHO68299.1 peptidoglycan DD-metalloendopeptidase family protein [Aestuariicella hydrocarbonica]